MSQKGVVVDKLGTRTLKVTLHSINDAAQLQDVRHVHNIYTHIYIYQNLESVRTLHQPG